MPSLLWICLELALIGIAAFVIAYSFQRWKSSFHRIAPPRPGSPFRISIGSALLRTRLDCISEELWRFDPPVSGSNEIIVKTGQRISGEYLSSTGVLRFYSEVVEVEESGYFTIKTPSATRIHDRRAEPRDKRTEEVLIEEKKSVSIDLSPLGGRFETEYPASRGERIRLDFPQIPEPIFGWVLEIYPNQIRVRFEDRLPYFR